MRTARARMPRSRKHRKGYMLNELLIMLAAIFLLLLISAGLFHTLMRQLPDDLKDFNEYTTLRHLMRHVETDIRAARALPESALGMAAGTEVLPLETGDGPVVYARTPEEVIRYVTDPNGLGRPVAQATWALPHTVLDWQIRSNPDGPYAVEIHTHVQRKVEGREEKHFENAHVFYLRSQPGDMP